MTTEHQLTFGPIAPMPAPPPTKPPQPPKPAPPGPAEDLMAGCAHCHRIRMDGIWTAQPKPVTYDIAMRTGSLTHGICPTCAIQFRSAAGLPVCSPGFSPSGVNQPSSRAA